MAEGMDFHKSSLSTHTYAHDLKGQLKIGEHPSSMESCGSGTWRARGFLREGLSVKMPPHKI